MSALISRIVAASCRRPWTILLGLAVLCVWGVVFTHAHFAMTTDTAQLISPKTAWRQREAAVDRAFPQGADQLVVVVDGQTPELAETAAASLTARLATRKDLALSVRRPDGGPFFARNGLLFLSRQQVAETTSQLVTAQPVLGPLAADPSLRGIMNGLSTLMQGVTSGQTTLAPLDPLLKGLADAVQRLDQGHRVFFSWEALLSQGHGAPAPRRRIILVQGRLDYSALEPGAKVEHGIRQLARSMGLDAAHGVTVRLTGQIPLADQEFSSLADRAWLVGGAMLVAVFLLLWGATRSMRLVSCILITTITGLILTMGVGLAAEGRFNLISVAFIPLFVGLGIDFGIQLIVRFRAERLSGGGVGPSLERAASGIGGSLAVAAAAITLGFFAFLPTSYIGVSELGVIAGLGMIIALILNITVLPALVVLIHPPEQELSVGYAWFAPVDRFLVERRKVVLAAFGVAVLVSIALMPFVRFDFNPLHLQNPKGEAMATLNDLMHDPQDTPNTIDVLRPSLAAADRTAQQLSKLPEVDQAITLSSFVPEDQQAKLATIQDASLLLDTAINPFVTQPPPTDAENVQAIIGAAAALRSAAGASAGPAAADARRLAAGLDVLARAPASIRAEAQQALTAPLGALLDQIRNMLAAQPVTLQSLPPDLVRDWRAPSGEARVQVLPKGDSNSNRVLVRFAKAVRQVAPDASGGPISIQEAAKTIEWAFIEAGVLALLAVALLLFIRLRSITEVAFTLAPVVLSGFLTLATCVVINQPINFANIIAFPLLFGVGVAFHIYFVMAWRGGETHLLQSSLARAVLFSALTTGVSFGSLWLSSHPGTASMGKILMISIVWTLVCALLFEPALLGPPPAKLRT